MFFGHDPAVLAETLQQPGETFCVRHQKFDDVERTPSLRRKKRVVLEEKLVYLDVEGVQNQRLQMHLGESRMQETEPVPMLRQDPYERQYLFTDEVFHQRDIAASETIEMTFQYPGVFRRDVFGHDQGLEHLGVAAFY